MISGWNQSLELVVQERLPFSIHSFVVSFGRINRPMHLNRYFPHSFGCHY